jgi:hypothetical protein
VRLQTGGRTVLDAHASVVGKAGGDSWRCQASRAAGQSAGVGAGIFPWLPVQQHVAADTMPSLPIVYGFSPLRCVEVFGYVPGSFSPVKFRTDGVSLVAR